LYYSSRALVIKTLDYRESDKLVTLFSEREGKIRAIARGVKKPKSSLRACVQPFCHSQLFFSAQKELDLLTQGRVLEFYGNIREEMSRTLFAVYLMELLDKGLADRVAFPTLYKITLETLQHLNNYGVNPLVLRYFELRLVQQLGYQPELEACIKCGNKNCRRYNFSLADGGIVCQPCSAGIGTNHSLSGEALAVMRLLLAHNIQVVNRVRASQSALAQIEGLLEKYLEYHLERRFAVKDTIRILKNYKPRLTSRQTVDKLGEIQYISDDKEE
jgi:DNA repair protein RecO (recombination protein O)